MNVLWRFEWYWRQKCNLTFSVYLRAHQYVLMKNHLVVHQRLPTPCRNLINTNILSTSKLTRGWFPKFATGLNVLLRPFLVSFCQLHNIFHKTEVQTVILRCWTDLYLNWFKSNDRNPKNAKNRKKQKKHK